MQMGDALEIERKFLVPVLPDLSEASRADLRQGYVTVPDDTVEVRLRQKDHSFVLSLKTGEGVVRSEREISLSAEQFETLWPGTTGRRVEKVRWTGRLDNGLSYELDVFAGDLAPLLTVEVEFDSVQAAAAFVPPDWFGRDVSNEKRFRNKSLALNGAVLVSEMFS